MPGMHSSVRVHCRCSGQQIAEPVPFAPLRVQMTETRENVDVTPGQTFFIILIIIPGKPIHVLKCMVVVHAIDPPKSIAFTEITQFDF